MAFTLTVNGVLLDRAGAWGHRWGLLRLLGGPDVRGSNTLIPGAAGTVANKLRTTETVYDLELMVHGHKKFDNSAWSDPITGKFGNLLYLQDNVADPASTATVAATLTLPDATTRTAQVQIRGWEVASDHGPGCVVTYDLVVPAGRFT